MSLSVLVATREPASRVAAVVAPLRDVADEVVVAVDHRVPEERLGGYEEVADRLVRFEYSGTNRGLAWLHEQCSGEWVLSLAGDEAVGRELADALPELCAERSLRQCWFPTRWVWPDGAHWLDELPWFPDFHNRLVRNDDATWFEGRKHTGAHPQLPMRYAEAPIYHLACVMETVAAREERVRRYDLEAPGLLAHGGGGLNERMYLPERFARRPGAPIPREDLPLVAAVLDAGSDRLLGPPRRPVPVGLRAEIDERWAGRLLEPSAYRARIAPMERDHRIALGEVRPVHVRVSNEGTVAWPAGVDGWPEIRLSYHWLARDGAVVVHDGVRTSFPETVEPGRSAIVPAVVSAPPEPGEHVLALDLVHEHVRWFGCERRIAMAVEGEPEAPRRWSRRRR